MQDFTQFPLSQATLNAISALGWRQPTAVQVASIPHLLAGRDLVAQARTGTGKTGAFGAPMVERASRQDPATRLADGPVALVLVPTRELALQVSEELRKLARGTTLQVVPIYGGVGFNPQTQALRQRARLLVVATPGRLLDHLGQETIRLDGVRVLILDEADRMLDMGFLPDVERILQALPRQRQTALFSATLPEPIRRLAQRFLHNAASVRVEPGPTATPLAAQYKVHVASRDKGRALLALLEKERPASAIVFTRTKHLARRLARNLDKAGWGAIALQGNMSQSARERAIADFRGGNARILVATDIASRGLDIPDVTHIVNFDVPREPEAYVHRVGRTARMGKTGRAFTFLQEGQQRDLRDLERVAGLLLEPFDVGPLPPPQEAEPEDRTSFRPRFREQPYGAGSRRAAPHPHAQAPRRERPRRFPPREAPERGEGGPRGRGPWRGPSRRQARW